MMDDTSSMVCCGMSELGNIREDEDPETSLMRVDPDQQGIVIFSDVNTYSGTNHRYRYGKALATLIGKAKLGGVIVSPPARNPNTSHMVRSWTWTLNRRALKAWQTRLRKADPERWDSYDPYYNDWNDDRW